MTRLAAFGLALILLSAPLAAEAQPAKIARIGVLSGGSAEPPPLLDAFRQTLRDLGRPEDSILIEYRFAEARPERLPGLAAELIRLDVDVIVAINTPASQAAKAATKTIPIVFTWVLWNAGNPTATRFFKDMEDAAPRLGIRLQPLGVRGAGREEVQNAIAAAVRAGAGALFVIEETMLLSNRTLILDQAAKSRLPTASTNKEFVQAGGLASYGVNLPDMFRQTARYVDRILRGSKPADLPVEQPTKFELSVNLKTAKALGLTIPPSVLLRADEVIQ